MKQHRMIYAIDAEPPLNPNETRFTLNLSKVKNFSTFMTTCELCFHFPEDFPHNWDALADYLMDLSWTTPNPWFTVVTHSQHLESRAADLLAPLQLILIDAADFWHNQGKLFHSAFVSPPAVLRLLPSEILAPSQSEALSP